MIRVSLLSALPLLIALGCAGDPVPQSCPPFGDAGVVNPPSLIQDQTLQEVIERYQITLVKTTTRSGQPLACSQIPGTYAMSNNQVVIISTMAYNRPNKNAKAEVVNNIKFPVDQPMLLVAEGLARDAGGQIYMVARGCVGPIRFESCNPIPVGMDRHVEINLIATTGAPCKGQTQGCEASMICLSDITGGYCAKANCSTDGRCPPASTCIVNKNSVGSCMRKCATITDCMTDKTKGQGVWDCAWRRAGDGSCKQVCVPPDWNFKCKCTAGTTGSCN